MQLDNDYFPAAPYYQGRFSNGPIYLETAASALGDVLDSFAAGGATVGVPGSSSVLPVYPPYAGEQSVVEVPSPSGVQQVCKLCDADIPSPSSSCKKHCCVYNSYDKLDLAATGCICTRLRDRWAIPKLYIRHCTALPECWNCWHQLARINSGM